MEEWSEEQIKEMESKYGPGVDERWVAAMIMKEVLGPVQAMFNAMRSGEGMSEEQLEWLKGPLPRLNPNHVPNEEGDDVERGRRGTRRVCKMGSVERTLADSCYHNEMSLVLGLASNHLENGIMQLIVLTLNAFSLTSS